MNNIEAPVDKPGLPLLILDTISDRKDRFSQLDLICIEYNDKNYSELEEIIEDTKGIPSNINVKLELGKFESRISEVIDRTGGSVPISFFFLDPFGFRGLCFENIEEFAPLSGNEVLITFMARDMNRFLESEPHKEAVEVVFGKSISEIRDDVEEYSPDKWEPLVEYYSNEILEGEMGVNFTINYRLCEPNSRKTLYYLVHGSNHIAGLKLMKEILSRKGAEGRLCLFMFCLILLHFFSHFFSLLIIKY